MTWIATSLEVDSSVRTVSTTLVKSIVLMYSTVKPEYSGYSLKMVVTDDWTTSLLAINEVLVD